eukprot:comp31182_c0_seq1/m.47250 comp31182_c0_seq1/g.47250  ORF comp31182_c0_seq1/g.47250 comp31182_c0_seq1/m.47250 type:complete len:209 (-) comp31182_c0_seq1:502-1128(-)
MSSLKISYFAIKGRAEASRLALFVGGIDFADERLSFAQFKSLQEAGILPYGQLPILTRDGQVIAQSRTILRFCGRLANLYPTDAWEAAIVDEVVDTIEDINQIVVNTFELKDEEKKRAREAMLVHPLPWFFKGLEGRLKQAGTGYFVGEKLTIADLQVYDALSWVKSGILDHVPTTVLDGYPLLSAHLQRVDSHPRVAEWNAAHRKKE